jgi:hypothetical protein
MSQYLLSRSEQQHVANLLSDGGAVTVDWVERIPLVKNGESWRRFNCCCGAASVAGCISEHQQLPGSIVVSVSLDIRRVHLIWHLATDIQPVRRLNHILEQAGATPLLDAD